MPIMFARLASGLSNIFVERIEAYFVFLLVPLCADSMNHPPTFNSFTILDVPKIISFGDNALSEGLDKLLTAIYQVLLNTFNR